MTTLGELTKLLEQGFLTGEYVHSSKDGDYKFELRTMTPLEEIEAQKEAAKVLSEDDYEKRVYLAIETLSRSVTKVNGIDLDKVPGAEGDTAQEKKKFVLKKFSERLLVDLWNKYNETKARTLPTGSKEESEAVKK